MKKFISLSLLVGLIFLSPLFQGCGTPGSSAHKTEAVTVSTVNIEMERWKAYVYAGKSTQAKLDSVKAMYKEYYDAQLAAKAAEAKWIKSKSDTDQTAFVTATAAASVKAAGLTTVIEAYMHSK